MQASIGLAVAGASKETLQKDSNGFIETMVMSLCVFFYTTTFQVGDNLDVVLRALFSDIFFSEEMIDLFIHRVARTVVAMD